MEKPQKNAEKIQCELCNFKCSKQSEWDRHVITRKHQNRTNENIIHSKNAIKFTCGYCNKNYNARNSLWYHQKKCNQNITQDDTTNKDEDFVFDKEFVMTILKQNKEVIQQNSELKNMMMEFIKTGTHNTNNTTNTNSHNKSFNLNFFLNETCKDAMNITDFVNSIQLQLSDLERVGEVGYVDGISNIIIKNLKQLDVTKRPVHCTDKKREVLYVKDENKWEKEEAENKLIRKAIKRVSHKNILMLSKFKDAHPDCSKSDSKYSDQYNKITVESFGGAGDDDAKKEDKIIRNLSKTIVIEREQEPL
jgi:hypothetical protein